MMDLKKHFKTDEALENEGVWVDLGEGARLKVARLGNDGYKAMFQRELKPHRRQMKQGLLSEEVADNILIKCMAHHILMDWEGIEFNGQSLPYSHENAIMLFRELKDFRDLVHEISQEMEVFKSAELVDAAEN